MPKPVLSIGIIFKNEIRCLERCLKSLGPLRKSIPCELVMADTGADDGSRAIAKEYADILIDFPWINDFSAARNAVMDCCSGRWYFGIDADEWLDEDIKELSDFLRANNRKEDTCTVIVRNYLSREENADYTDFCAVRLLRMSTGLRYEGAIHEAWRRVNPPLLAVRLGKTILHHDGYIDLNKEAGKEKRERNLEILRKELLSEPDNVRLLLQYIESSDPEPDHMDFVRRGVSATEAKCPEWESFGPAVFRYAVMNAKEDNLAELEEWIAKAEALFPHSFFTNIDVEYVAFLHSWESEDYKNCIQHGLRYLHAMKDFKAGRGDQSALLFSTLQLSAPKWERALRIILAVAYVRNNQPEYAVETLMSVEFHAMDSEQTQNCVLLLQELHTQTNIDTAPLVRQVYKGICRIKSSEDQPSECQRTFFERSARLFTRGYLRKEDGSANFHRHACTFLAPLAGLCDLGDAAAVMAAETVQGKEQSLAAAENPYQMPREVLRRAVLAGVVFPLPSNLLTLEEMDILANRLTRQDAVALIEQAAVHMDEGIQQLAWARGIAIAVAGGAWEWANNEESMTIARLFAKVEAAFVSRFYMPEILCEENIRLLPPMHRFGWYCGRAFEALDRGDASEYVRLLRFGLKACPRMKAMVEFLTKYTPQLQTVNSSGELLALAKKVRTMLSAYTPDDPAVVMLKQSVAYQKVAHLIEGPEICACGGLAQ